MGRIGKQRQVNLLSRDCWPVIRRAQMVLNVSSPVVVAARHNAAKFAENLAHGLPHNIRQHIQTACSRERIDNQPGKNVARYLAEKEKRICPLRSGTGQAVKQADRPVEMIAKSLQQAVC